MLTRNWQATHVLVCMALIVISVWQRASNIPQLNTGSLCKCRTRTINSANTLHSPSLYVCNVYMYIETLILAKYHYTIHHSLWFENCAPPSSSSHVRSPKYRSVPFIVKMIIRFHTHKLLCHFYTYYHHQTPTQTIADNNNNNNIALVALQLSLSLSDRILHSADAKSDVYEIITHHKTAMQR